MSVRHAILARSSPYAAETVGHILLDRPLTSTPMVSCIMASHGNAFPARHAIDCFLRQSYADRELVIVSKARDCEVKALVEALNDPRIRFFGVPDAQRVGELRNFAIARASGSLMCVWDDDDLSHCERLRWQVAALIASDADACFLSRVTLWWPSAQRLAESGRRIWENTMLAKIEDLPPYTSLERGSDTALVKDMRGYCRFAHLELSQAYCYIAHDANLWSGDHFDTLFRAGKEAQSAKAYAAEFERLDGELALTAYRDGLATA